MLFTETAISFPGLGIGEINPPTHFTVFGKDIYFYAVIIAFGMLLALFYAMKRAKQFGLTSDNIVDAFIYGVPCAIIFARLYYCIFYRDANGLNPYFQNPVTMLYIWEGGLAIYGGVIGAVLGLFIYCKIHKKKMLPILDLVCLGLLIGQMIGRWGNFMNREAFGSEVPETFFLRMGLTQFGVTKYYHPTFLYESVWNLIGFIILHFVSKKRKYDGQILLMYLAWYGLGRLWIEGLRMDSLYLGATGIRVSQLIAGASFIISVVIMAVIHFIVKPSPERMYVNDPNCDAARALAEKQEIEALENEASETSETETESSEEPTEETSENNID